MVVLTQTKSSSLSEVSYSHGVDGIKGESIASQRYPCTERTELMAWNSVGRRIAAVFVEAADEDKADELKKEALCRPYANSGDSTDCSTSMCSPAPSSVFPTDVSTQAGTYAAALSEVASDSGNDTDYDFFSEHDDDSSDFDSPDGFKGIDKSFQGMDESFKGMDTMTFSGMEAAFKVSLNESPAESQENWRRVGQRLAQCFDVSDDEADELPHNEAFFSLQQVAR